MSEETRSRMQAVAFGGVVVVLTYFLIRLMVTLRVELAVLFLGFVLGLTLAPLAEYGERLRIPRIASILLLYAVLAGALGLFIWWAVPVVIDEAEAAPEALEDLRAWYEDFARGKPLPNAEELWTRGQEMLETRLEAGIEQALVVFQVLLHTFMILVIALFTTITKDRMYDLTLSLLPARRRPAAGEFLQDVGTRLRRFVLAELATMLAVGIMTYIGLVIIGVPLAPLLAVLAFLFEVVPIIGPWAAAIPAVAVALTEGVWHAVAVAILCVLVQQLENHVLVPVLHSRSVNLPGLLIVTAILLGVPLLGVLGALVAIPVAVIIYAVVHDLLVPWRQGQVETPLSPTDGAFLVQNTLVGGAAEAGGASSEAGSDVGGGL